MNDVLKNIEDIKLEALIALRGASSAEELEKLRIEYLGTKGRVTDLMRSLGAISKEDRPKVGQAANKAKEEITLLHKEIQENFKNVKSEAPALDVTLPGRKPARGHQHLITKTMDEICQIFGKLGLSIVEGPEVETDYYNFEALNFPPNHPSRDMQETLFVGDKLLLRTHTSPVQIRTMEKTKPPVWIVVPGKTFRRDDDITHSPMFNQIEGLVVDKGITMADLKGVLTAFAAAFFSPDTKIRLRPSFFPFTEPSAEVDIACVLCGGQGCRLCKGSGWLELLGSGMVDPALYGFVGYDPNEVSGFAFGLGVDRAAMLKYGLTNIRHLYEGDLRFSRQFS
ncbi:MAG: phenylalanine--tRNA ligase subunit alpha [Deltaproteobacteria bacterium]|jgi:phenylalanyl-tRNA synthetase alpha chain|nr:phenylalanine--tRNA ligase subunit alpha [Deltaproteobacteria bacterium]